MPQRITIRGLESNLGSKIGVRGKNAGFDRVSWFNFETSDNPKVGIKGTLAYEEKSGKYAVYIATICIF